jgi:hypothetical protein
MSVWLCIPSARPAAEIEERLEKWHRQGYKIALWRNGPHRHDPIGADSITVTAEYVGWGPSINELSRAVFALDSECDWIVGGGDDTDPDLAHAAEKIARQCSEHFANMPSPIKSDGSTPEAWNNPAFGVMQPTGDRWGENEPWARAAFPDAPAYIDRICGSPWIGREFARRVNQGKGPFWREYFHMFADEELQNVAARLGLLWQRRDLIHFHEHPMREGRMATQADWQKEIYSSEHWQASKTLFESRKAAGFPGSELIA